MKCDEANELIYLYDVLSPEERDQLEKHLSECASCRALEEEVLRGRQLIQRAATIEHPVPNQAALTHRVMSAIGPARDAFFDFQSIVQWFDSTFSRYAMATASLFLVAFFILELASSPTAERISRSAHPSETTGNKGRVSVGMSVAHMQNRVGSKKRKTPVLTLTLLSTTLPLRTDQFEFANKYLVNEKENQMQASYNNLYRCLLQCRETGGMNCSSCKTIFTKIHKRI